MKHGGLECQTPNKKLTRVIRQVKNTRVYYLGRDPRNSEPLFSSLYWDSVLR